MTSQLLVITLMNFCAETPYPESPVIADVQFDWSTHQRSAQGSDNFQLTWADDGHLYGAWGDGGGFGGTNSRGRVGLGVARIEGPADSYQGVNLWGGQNSVASATFDGKSWGMICVDGTLSMWVVPDKPDGKKYRNHYEYVELARSTDHGKQWTKADWKFTQTEQLTIPTFLNFGQDNSGVPEEFGDFVYSYFIRPASPTMEQEGPHAAWLIVHKPGVLYLARVSKDDLFSSKSNYQFFCGLNQSGQPRWGSVEEKQPVFEDPNGVGWCLSACYHPTLQGVLLCTEHEQSKQGLLGIFDAPTPWGPWTTVKYDSPDQPFGAQRDGSSLDWKNNVFFAAFPTKWFEGNSFTMNFTGAGQGKDNDSFNTVRGQFILRQK